MATRWDGKKVLCIGDSLTEAGVWPVQLKKNLHCEVTSHCKGGLGMLEVIDGGTSSVGELGPLTADMVKDKDLIIFFIGYNDRGIPEGLPGDRYFPGQKDQEKTVAGMLQYCIDQIYARLMEAQNLACQLMLVTPHCVGKYEYIQVDGYHEYPENSGRTVRTLAQTMALVASENNLPCCNLWECSGINRYTWEIFSNKPGVDEVHCSTKGYQRIGNVITGAVIQSFGI